MFKVGDKVRCVDPSRCLKLGVIYTVNATKVELATQFIRPSKADGEFYYAARFEKVTSAFKGNIK